MKLDEERMYGHGEYKVDGYSVNYLFGLNDLCEKYVNENFSILELGSNDGVSTNLFCGFAKSVTAVDIQQTKKFNIVLSTNKNLKFFNMSFQQFFKNCNEKFDLIYIDGMHTYDDVVNDIKNSLNFIKENGYISGHDYNSTCPGVIKAVNEFFTNVEVFNDSSWIAKI